MPYNSAYDPTVTIQSVGVPNAQPENFVFSAAATHCVIVFQQSGTLSVTGFRLPVGGISGTPTNALQWQLKTSTISGYAFGTVLASGVATPASYTSLHITGLNQTLTDGQYYCLYVQNVHATPASNWWAFLMGFVQVDRAGSAMIASYDSGSTWDDEWGYVPGLQLSYSDNSRAGRVWTRSSHGFTSFIQLYNSAGSRFALGGVRLRPPGRFWLHRVVCVTRLVGTYASAGILVARVYRGTTLVATSNDRPGSSSTGGNRYQAWYFSTPVLLEPDSDYVVAIGQRDSTGGTAANYWFPLGSGYAFYTPSGTTDAGPWGIHTVHNTASILSSWTVSTEQMYMGLGLSPAEKAVPY